MKTTFLFITALWGFAYFSLSAAFPSNKGEQLQNLSAAENSLIKADNKFGLKLFHEINRRAGEKNIFISPLSVAMALSMAMNGAAGATEEHMKTALELTDMRDKEVNDSYHHLIKLLKSLDPQVTFEIANSLWYRQGFTVEPGFIDINKKFFDAEVQALNFGDPTASKIINQWVKEKTRHKIEKIVDQVPTDLMLYLLNAIYFKGTWTYEFNPKSTKKADFHLTEGTTTSCNMMRMTRNFHYHESADFQAIDLLYGNEKFSMTIILPQPNKNLNTLITELDAEQWHQLIANFQIKEGTLELPRFTLEYEMTLNDVLSSLGMGIAFNSTQANFTKINKDGNLFISEVKHKAYVNVDEEGTEAAAVTSVGITLAAVRTSFYMRVDRPFLFVIHDRSWNTILFIGKVVEPPVDF